MPARGVAEGWRRPSPAQVRRGKTPRRPSEQYPVDPAVQNRAAAKPAKPSKFAIDWK
jgi:hypothetical protein